MFALLADLRRLYPPPARVLTTWVCTRCHRGWPITMNPDILPGDLFAVPTCSRCSGELILRGAHAAVPLR